VRRRRGRLRQPGRLRRHRQPGRHRWLTPRDNVSQRPCVPGENCCRRGRMRWGSWLGTVDVSGRCWTGTSLSAVPFRSPREPQEEAMNASDKVYSIDVNVPVRVA
jgi:hypothetical protein